MYTEYQNFELREAAEACSKKYGAILLRVEIIEAKLCKTHLNLGASSKVSTFPPSISCNDLSYRAIY